MKNKKNKIIFFFVIIVSFFLMGFFTSSLAAETTYESGKYGSAGYGTESEDTTTENATKTTKEAATTTTTTTSSSSYQNQEKIPGSAQTTEFVPYLKSIINFGFAIIGILALFMLLIGAYQYLMAAGSDNASSAKETISSAFLGLLLGLCAWVILNKINPDLVAMREPSASSATSSSTGSTAATTASTPSTNSGKCVAGTGNCAETNMSCFGSEAKNASIVCAYESDGVAKAGGDKCNGTNVSFGLMQMNLTCHDLGLGCDKAFNGCLGTNVSNSTCQIKDTTTYEKCKAAMMDPSTNIKYACQLQKSGGWGHWTGAKKCGIS